MWEKRYFSLLKKKVYSDAGRDDIVEGAIDNIDSREGYLLEKYL